MHKLSLSYYYHFPGLERLYDGLMKCICMYVHMYVCMYVCMYVHRQLPESIEDK